MGENLEGVEGDGKVIRRRAEPDLAGRRHRHPARHAGARQRGDQALGGERGAAPPPRSRLRLRDARRPARAHRRRRPARSMPNRAGAQERRSQGRARDAGVGTAADPGQAAAPGRDRHAAHLGRAHERHLVRHRRAAHLARGRRRRPARGRADGRRDRAERRRAPARPARARPRSSSGGWRAGRRPRRTTRAATGGCSSTTSSAPSRAATSTSCAPTASSTPTTARSTPAWATPSQARTIGAWPQLCGGVLPPKALSRPIATRYPRVGHPQRPRTVGAWPRTCGARPQSCVPGARTARQASATTAASVSWMIAVTSPGRERNGEWLASMWLTVPARCRHELLQRRRDRVVALADRRRSRAPSPGGRAELLAEDVLVLGNECRGRALGDVRAGSRRRRRAPGRRGSTCGRPPM